MAAENNLNAHHQRILFVLLVFFCGRLIHIFSTRLPAFVNLFPLVSQISPRFPHV